MLQRVSWELGQEEQRTTWQSVPERHDAGRSTSGRQQGYHSDADDAGELSPALLRRTRGQACRYGIS